MYNYCTRQIKNIHLTLKINTFHIPLGRFNPPGVPPNKFKKEE